MVRPINRNILILSKPSVAATKADVSIGDDLLETLNANADACVGMAANMITWKRQAPAGFKTGFLKIS